MEKRAPSVEEQPTNLSFAPPGYLTTRVYSFVAATAAIHEAWMRTSRVCCGSDFGTFGLANENGGHSMPLRQLGTYRARARQIRKALHMLALSGVVRPSHVELRYAISFVNIEAHSSTFQDKPAAVRPSRLLQKFFKLMTWPTKDHRSFGRYPPSNNRLRLRKNISTSTCSSP